MADEKLNVSPEENPQSSLFDAGPEGAPARDAPTEPPQTGGEPPAQDAPAGAHGEVNVSADQIEKLLAERRAAGRAEVEKNELPEPEQPPTSAPEEKAAGEKGSEKKGKASTVKDKEETPAAPPPAPEQPSQPCDATRAEKEEIVYLKLSELFPFKDHPFGVWDDAEMKRISEYLNSSVSYPFFVVVDGNAEYNSLLSDCSSFERIKASQYCNGNSYANYDSRCDGIQNGSGRRILLGLGDCVALSGQTNVLGRIKGLPIRGKLVVLCRGIRAYVAKLNEADQKFNARRYCTVDSYLDYAIVRISPEVYFPHSYNGFQCLLQDLEIGKKGALYVHTDLPLQSARSITFAYEAILEKTKGFSVEASVLNDECWSEYNQDSNLDKDEPDLLHWRTYLNMKLQPVSGGYLKLVLSSSPDYETYRKRLFDALLDIPPKQENFWEFYGERKKLLKNLTGTESSRYVAVSAQKNEDRVYYLTDLTEPERFSIIKELVKLGRIPAELPVIYPARSKYLAEYAFNCKHADVLTAYFTRY